MFVRRVHHVNISHQKIKKVIRIEIRNIMSNLFTYKENELKNMFGHIEVSRVSLSRNLFFY